MMTNENPTIDVVVESKAAQEKPKSSSISAWCAAEWRPILSELISTTILILFGCMSCIPIDGLLQQSPFYSAFGFGLTVMVNIQIFGHISGAHMNPAVTLAAVIWGSTSIPRGLFFVIVQISGAIIGYGILMGLAPIDVASAGICMTSPHQGLNVIQALGIEVVLTGILSLINCALWDPVNKHKQDSVPIKFGLTIIGLSLIGGPLTGASMNPARSIGPVVWTGMWADHWVYWVGPFVGAALTAIFYKLVFYKDEKQNY